MPRVRLFVVVFSLLYGVLASAAQPRPPASWTQDGLTPAGEIPGQTFAAMDPLRLRQLDAQENKSGQPLRFAVPHASRADIHHEGLWETLGSGDRVWRMRFDVPGATDINFGFERLWLPPGATLHIYDAERSFFQGPWDASSNKAHGRFWTPVVPGGSAVIELRVPAGAMLRPVLTLKQVAGGYRDFFGREGGPHLRGHGDCNIDVACPEGDEWRDEIRSVARYTNSGLFLCTGSLINDVPRSLTPYFLTANHCLSTPVEAAGVVVYWNFEAPTCGEQDGGLLAQNQSGATLAATRQDVDMTLLVLDDDPDPAFNVHYAGWDRSGDQPGGAVGIHHPRGHVKSISVALSELDSTPNCVFDGISDTHWHVPFWDQGTTEGGSSGSGIWNPQNKRIVGFLTGGAAACGNQSHDCYGKFSVAWDGLLSLLRLRDWLDPEGVNPDGVYGTDPDTEQSFAIVPEALHYSQCGFDDLEIGIEVTSEDDFADPVTLSITNQPEGVTGVFEPNPVTPPAQSVLTLGNLDQAGSGDFVFTVHGTSGDIEASRTIGVSLDNEAPGTTGITTPEDGATAVSTTPTVAWTAADGAFQYELEIATDAAFDEPVYATVVFDSEHRVSAPLDFDTRHYARVRAVNECAQGEWSTTVSFTTEAAPEDSIYRDRFESGEES